MANDDPPPYSAACQITGFHPPTPSAPHPDGNTQVTANPSNVGYRPCGPGGPVVSNEPPYNESSSKYFDNQHRQSGVPSPNGSGATDTNVAPPQGYVAPSHVVYQPQEGTAMVMPTHQQIHGPIHGTIQSKNFFTYFETDCKLFICATKFIKDMQQLVLLNLVLIS